MKKVKKILYCAVAITVLLPIIIIFFILDNEKTWEIYFALYLGVACFILCWLTFLAAYCSSYNDLIEYNINGYNFKPFDLDDYLSLRILLDDSEVKNDEIEKKLLEDYRLKAYTYYRKKIYYIVFKENEPIGLILFKKNRKKKIAHVEIIKSKINLDGEIKELLNFEKLTKY